MDCTNLVRAKVVVAAQRTFDDLNAPIHKSPPAGIGLFERLDELLFPWIHDPHLDLRPRHIFPDPFFAFWDAANVSQQMARIAVACETRSQNWVTR